MSYEPQPSPPEPGVPSPEVRAEDPAETLRRMAELMDSGLETKTEPFPENAVEFAKILDELRALDRDDLEGLLVIGGFVDHPYGPDEERCQECIYFLVHRQWCDLPELSLPVEPNWWCRLWKI